MHYCIQNELKYTFEERRGAQNLLLLPPSLITFIFKALTTFHEINQAYTIQPLILFTRRCFGGLPVSYPSFMEIVHGRYKLSEEVSGPLLRQTELFLGPDKRHQVSTQSTFQNQTVQGGGLQKDGEMKGSYMI